MNYTIVKEIYDFLKSNANDDDFLITYGELGHKFGIHYRTVLPKYLKAVAEFTNSMKYPDICVLVVRQDTMIPGVGYFGNITHKNMKEIFAKDIVKVRNFNWSITEFNL